MPSVGAGKLASTNTGRQTDTASGTGILKDLTAGTFQLNSAIAILTRYSRSDCKKKTIAGSYIIMELLL